MSHGPGRIERAVTAALIQAPPDRTFTVAGLCAELFGPRRATRAQRISVLRAAHRAMRRSKEADQLRHDTWAEAFRAAEAKFGNVEFGSGRHAEFERFVDEHPAKKRYDRMEGGKLQRWRVTERADRIVVFHDRSYSSGLGALGSSGVAKCRVLEQAADALW